MKPPKPKLLNLPKLPPSTADPARACPAAALGISRNSLNETVTDQGLDGILAYIGLEERGVRTNPLEAVGGLLDQLGS